ncbi:MAG: hypothetical protein AB7I27_02595 [Bacteriovoracaceae bacterium]
MKNYFLGLVVTSMSLISSISYAKEMVFEAIPNKSPGYERAIITTENLYGGKIKVSLENVASLPIHFSCKLSAIDDGVHVYVCGKNKTGLMIMNYNSNTPNRIEGASFAFNNIIEEKGDLIPTVFISAYLK